MNRWLRSRGVVEVGLAAAVALGTGLLALIPRAFHPWFYYWDDMLQSFVPQWKHLGERLLAGELPLLEPEAWMGGNTIAEAGYGVWNPVNLLDFLIAAKIDDLSLIGMIVAVQYLMMLAVGVYLLAREYGALRWAAVMAAVAVPFSGFTLFYEATRWPGGLQAFAWVALFWVAVRKYARSRGNPIAPMVLGYLTITCGNPYGAVGMIIVLGAVAVELVVTRHAKRLPGLIGVGLVSGAAGVLVFLPLLFASSVGWRRDSAVWNEGFLQPGLGDLLGMSTMTYRPDVQSWWGPVDPSPSTYLAFFILPLLPWLKYRSIARRLRQISSVFVIGLVFTALTVGMSNFGMFRWPIRLIEYAYLAITIVFALLVSFGLQRDRVRARSIASGAIILAGAYMAFSMWPGAYRWHLVAALLTAALVAGILWSFRREAHRLAAAVVVFGVMLTLGLQGWVFIRNNPAAPDDAPTSAATLVASAEDYQGTTLFLLKPPRLEPDDVNTGRLIYGNMLSVAAPDAGVNRYTGLGFGSFADALCMDYRGGVCPDAYGALWEPVEANPAVDLADALGVETVIIARDLREIAPDDVPPGWRVASEDDARVVLMRHERLEDHGTVSLASEGIAVREAELSADRLSETVDVVAEDGASLVFERLAWPGYEIRIDGEEARIVEVDAGLAAVDVPAGEHEVTVVYRTPGLALGLAVLAVGAFAGVVGSIVHLVRRRRTRPAQRS